MDFKKKLKHAFRAIGKSPIVYNLIGTVAYVYSWIIGRTASLDIQGQEEFEQLIEENDGGFSGINIEKSVDSKDYEIIFMLDTTDYEFNYTITITFK